jgi:hypothetical protein
MCLSSQLHLRTHDFFWLIYQHGKTGNIKIEGLWYFAEMCSSPCAPRNSSLFERCWPTLLAFADSYLT